MNVPEQKIDWATEENTMTTSAPNLKVIALGFRGFPGVQGGIETHAEHLYPILARMGCDIEAVIRPCHTKAIRNTQAPAGIRYRSIWSPCSKGKEAIFHTLFGVLYAALRRPDILHIHAVGPALFAPLARLLGLRVVVTHHGADYERQKWGGGARKVLRMGERLGMGFANRRIVISLGIWDLVKDKYDRNSVLIPNGIRLPVLATQADILQQFDLSPGHYVLLVSRMVPEKRHLDLIAAFAKAALPGWKLVLVGASDHPDAYTREVLEAAEACPGVVCTGFQSGMALQELFSHAGIFVLPSSHEGLPIALLEALSYGLSVLASDIPAHLELGLEPWRYFPLGDSDALTMLLRRAAAQPMSQETRENQRQWVRARYDWEQVARRTLDVYQAASRRGGQALALPAPSTAQNTN